MKECGILKGGGVKTYCDPHIHFQGPRPQPPSRMHAPGVE